MNRLIFLLIPLLLFSCKNLPEIIERKEKTRNTFQKLHRHYPVKKTRYIHTIFAQLPGRNASLLTGVSIINPKQREIRSVLMTLEGMQILDVQQGSTLIIKHAVPPFDKKEAALGMVDDISLIFLKPAGILKAYGADRSGHPVIRYSLKEKRTLDLMHKKKETTLTLYDRNNRPLRTITWFFGEKPIPERIFLKAHGVFGYTLGMDLIESEPVN